MRRGGGALGYYASCKTQGTPWVAILNLRLLGFVCGWVANVDKKAPVLATKDATNTLPFAEVSAGRYYDFF